MQSFRRKTRRNLRRTPDCASSASRAQAFTIVEVAVVMLIMGIFAAVSAPAFLNSLLFHRVETAARRVKADIDQARGRARLTSTTQSVTFTGSTYTLSGAKHLDNPNNVYTVDLQKSPYSLDSAAANFNSTQVLSFDGYGTPSSGGTVVLSAKSHQCTITVNAVTGTTAITSNHTSGGTAEVAGG
jgi:prepilin-type N-terminal cleavage/methylation domain-containing protein